MLSQLSYPPAPVYIRLWRPRCQGVYALRQPVGESKPVVPLFFLRYEENMVRRAHPASTWRAGSTYDFLRGG